MSRCRATSGIYFKDYGSRGISVCERWTTFVNFLADMGERQVGTSIDRINNDGNYEPGNCKWSTRSEQMRNTRNSILSLDDLSEVERLVATDATLDDISSMFGIRRAYASRIRSRVKREIKARGGTSREPTDKIEEYEGEPKLLEAAV